ncbi:MAG: hypothetical protein U5K51_00065 [Flavobacteriaceae bacterium]|nr:hypothetical protein [Flavobacteriaceae bacterium]
MSNLTNFYERTKKQANDHMKKGQLNAYYKDLLKMHQYRRTIETT